MGSPIKVPIRSKIDTIIRSKGIKKTWIAEQMGISKSYLSQLTKTDKNGILVNAMSAENLFKLAHVLGVKVEEIAEYVEG